MNHRPSCQSNKASRRNTGENIRGCGQQDDLPKISTPCPLEPVNMLYDMAKETADVIKVIDFKLRKISWIIQMGLI